MTTKRRHFTPYGSYIAPCGYIADQRHPDRQTELRRETMCGWCQSHMTDLGDLPKPVEAARDES